MSITAGSGVEIAAIDTPALGDRSYLAHDGEVALVVDPQRDIDRVLALAAARGVRITHVFETHLHNDYVTGGLALALATGADYHVNAADPVPSTGCRPPTATSSRSARPCGCGSWPPPAHVHPPVLRAGGGRARHTRCSPAARCSTARPGGRTCSATRTPTNWRMRSSRRRGGWPPSCPRTRTCIPPTASAASARPPSPRATRPPSAGNGGSTRC